MFQNLTNYLLGFTNHDQRATAASSSSSTTITNEGVENNSLRLTKASEDDWVLVERGSTGNSDTNSDTNSMASLDIDDEHDDDFNDITLPLPLLLSRSSSTSSLPHNSNMDESWFLTPPPCFTSTGPIHMETSPLENLLIEHPSMSVYTHHMRRPVTNNVSLRTTTTTFVVTATGAAATIATGHVDTIEDDVVEPVVVVHRGRHINRMHILQQQELQTIKGKQEQKARIQKACQSMKRGHLERNNKAREINSRNRRQRRGERSQGITRSYANNNRKC